MTMYCKCNNWECPLKEYCLRYMIPPDSFMQSYSIYELDEEGSCNEFILWEVLDK